MSRPVPYLTAVATGVIGAAWTSGAIAGLSIIGCPAALDFPRHLSAGVWRGLYEHGFAAMPKFAATTAAVYLYAAFEGRRRTTSGSGGGKGNAFLGFVAAAALTVSIVPFTIALMSETNRELLLAAGDTSPQQATERIQPALLSSTVKVHRAATMADFEPRFSLLKVLGGWGIVRRPVALVYCTWQNSMLFSPRNDPLTQYFSMMRSMISGTSTAAVIGVASAIAGSVIWGTAAIPFMVGSSMGFAIGSFRWYHVSLLEALVQLKKHPALLRLHITSNFPWVAQLHAHDVGWFTAERFTSSWVLKSMLVVGWLSAEPALREIRDRQEAMLVDRYVALGMGKVSGSTASLLKTFSAGLSLNGRRGRSQASDEENGDDAELHLVELG
ncbi:hypothetical protein BN1708_014017 [Verticillium longisporum]|uniref:Uncharacterized protein n=1 Tax=Verticillium longisporum TaxID=100787 RepID=A0A0G4LRB4_VERLO|nr:hypothetical protein BN1708_014017 [Verticillium longisporum]